MTINQVRTVLYMVAKFLGDLAALKKAVTTGSAIKVLDEVVVLGHDVWECKLCGAAVIIVDPNDDDFLGIPHEDGCAMGKLLVLLGVSK
jgi:hypothetical protein